MSDASSFLADALGIPAETLPKDAALGTPAAWDSIGHMRLVLALEERLGRSLTSEEMLGLDSLSDVETLLG